MNIVKALRNQSQEPRETRLTNQEYINVVVQN